MLKFKKKQIINILISIVWFVNGFFCKILNLVPRHQEIVASILNEVYAIQITFTIGVLEIWMAFWVLSNYKTKINAVAQITIIISMNIIEYFLVPELLLWGKMNIIFALLFISIIYYNEFILKNKSYVS
jgi:hypothetical protein